MKIERFNNYGDQEQQRRYKEVVREMKQRGFDNPLRPDASLYLIIGENRFFEVHELAFKYACMFVQIHHLTPEGDIFWMKHQGYRMRFSDEMLIAIEEDGAFCPWKFRVPRMDMDAIFKDVQRREAQSSFSAA